MRTGRRDAATWTAGLALLGAVAAAAAAQAQVTGGPASSDARQTLTADAAAAPPIVYTPPDRGAPITRVAGASRGAGSDGTLKVAVVSPPRAGWSARPQPVLYWYLSGQAPEGARFELTVTDESSLATVIETAIGGPLKSGLHRVALADLGVTLKEGVEYQWHVAVVVDAAQRSSDAVAAGGIVYRPMPGSGPAGSVADQAVALAKRGYWYDAVDLIQRGLGRDRASTALASIERSLFDQAELSDIRR